MMTETIANTPTIINRRLLIEDSVTRVTLDGQPHILLTLIAVLSGLLVALIILGVLMFFVTCKHKYKSTSINNNTIGNLNPIDSTKANTLSLSLYEINKVTTVENIFLRLVNNSRSSSPTAKTAGSNGVKRCIHKLKKVFKSKKIKISPSLTFHKNHAENKLTRISMVNDIRVQHEIYTPKERF